MSGLLSAPVAAVAAPSSGTDVPSASEIKKDLAKYTSGLYVVTLQDAPAASYGGGIAGFPATRPTTGKSLPTSSARFEKYTDYLAERQRTIASKVGAKVLTSYTVATNGFGAKLTAVQAARLAKSSAVRAVVKNELLKPTAERSIDYLGITGEGGTWDQLGGEGNLGDGVVIGDIDTGIAPENPSFAGDPLGTTVGDEPYIDDDLVVYEKSDGETFTTPLIGDAEEWTDDYLSTKIIGADYFVAGFGVDNIGTPEADAEYLSPRDGAGHGSHTASTAAGVETEASVEGLDFGLIEGVAPEAKLAIYKACWTGNEPGTTDDDGCATLDLLNAIDAAVYDNVDVINFSIGGGAAQTTYDVLDDAFLSAAISGIFVSASAGNSGPAEVTADHGSPWYTTVAASTIPDYEGTVVTGDGEEYLGASVTLIEPGEVSGDFVAAEDVAAEDGVDPVLCGPDSLDPALVDGAIVLCDRGVYDRVAKSAEVARAGGIGMVLVNAPGGADDVDNDFHSLPTVHIHAQDHEAIHAYAETDGATVTLIDGDQVEDEETPVPQLADFSSRGPILADGSDVLKPDIAAPGVSILAAVANAEGADPQYAFYSGTSMAAPHVTGLAALYLSNQPDASPMEIKSALMTTASDLLDADGETYTDPFGEGAGQVEPADYLEPGLYYESGIEDWIAYLVGLGYYTEEDFGIPGIDASDLNQPSIAIGDLTAEQTITRTVTSTGPGTYTASIDIDGIDATVSPETLTFEGADETATYSVTFENATAPLDDWTTGSLTWSSDAESVRSPVAIHPTSVVPGDTVNGTGSTGTAEGDFTAGFTGTETLAIDGLAREQSESWIADDSLGTAAYDLFVYEAGEGATFGQFDVAPDVDIEGTDLDLIVYHTTDIVGLSDLAVVGTSATAAAAESVSVADPEPGYYLAEVDYYSTPGGETPYTMTGYIVDPATNEGAATVTPTSFPVAADEEYTYTVGWTGLPLEYSYFGVVRYGDSPLYTPVRVEVSYLPLASSTPPTVSGTYVAGSPLTADPGTWTHANSLLSFSYQWFADGLTITGASGPTFTPPAYLIGKSVGVFVTATNSATGDSIGAASAQKTVTTASGSALAVTAAPEVSGTFVNGQTLTASAGTWSVPNSDLTFTYQWTSDMAVIGGATSATFTPDKSYIGHDIAVLVTAHLAGTSLSVTGASQSETLLSASTTKLALKKKKDVARVTVKADKGRETGKVVVRFGSAKRTTYMSAADLGVVKVKIPGSLKKGTFSVTATYKGNGAIAKSTSTPKTLTVKKK